MPSAITTEQAPLGSVCCVFTDIINSTPLWEYDPIAMKTALTQHNRFVRDEIIRFGGYEVKSTGDGFQIIFSTARSAVQFSLAVQEGIQDIVWPEAIREYRRQNSDGSHTGLSVSIGMNFGEPFSIDLSPTVNRMDYFGPMVNRAARIEGEAGEGRIAVSDAFIAQLDCEQTPSVTLPTEFDDLIRTKVLRKTILGRPFELSPKGYRLLKGIRYPEYITVISIKTTY